MDTEQIVHQNCPGNLTQVSPDSMRFLRTCKKSQAESILRNRSRSSSIDAVAGSGIGDGRGRRWQKEATSLQSKHDSTHVERFTSPSSFPSLWPLLHVKHVGECASYSLPRSHTRARALDWNTVIRSKNKERDSDSETRGGGGRALMTRSARRTISAFDTLSITIVSIRYIVNLRPRRSALSALSSVRITSSISSNCKRINARNSLSHASKVPFIRTARGLVRTPERIKLVAVFFSLPTGYTNQAPWTTFASVFTCTRATLLQSVRPKWHKL